MQQTIDRLSRELNLPTDVVVKSYKAYWLFIRQTIEELPLKEDMDEETFSRLRTNFNIPNLGKLACTYERYIGIKKRHKVIQEKYAKHKED
jgi:hypothetical protein